ncbi:MAPEG family protein [Novosphingobium colocasiae]|uniref:MAPEG family protein n=1 Tax=Novosphingobium colocasiae TaxID=1256513 RepID=UPI0035B44547
MILQTTLSLAAAAAIINLWLAMRVAAVRRSAKVLHGDGGDALLAQRIRAQLNYVENTVFVLILSGLIEMTGKGGRWLAFVGAAYMLARVAHGFGMDKAVVNPARMLGYLVTMLTLVGLSAVAVLIALQVI